MLAAALRGRRALLVASTDLSHYLESRAAARHDGRVQRYVNQFEPEGLLEELEHYPEHERGRFVGCGAGPAVSVMLAARALGATNARVLRYATSGDVSGDFGAVVGYLAAALAGSIPCRRRAHEPHDGRGLPLHAGGAARAAGVARRAVAACLNGAAPPALDDPDLPAFEAGAFVTIEKGGELRGCIGSLETDRPVAETVARVAASAALEDPRFPPLRLAELGLIDFEISVLGPLSPSSSRAHPHRRRPPRPRRRARPPARAAAAAGRRRMAVGRRHVPRADLREGRPRARRVAKRRACLPVHGRGVRRARRAAGFQLR